MEPVVRIVLVSCAVTMTILGAFAIIRSARNFSAEEEARFGRRSAFTTEDYHADMKCDICFDDIRDETVSQCRCGKTFHHSCAEPTGECPYCGSPFSSFEPPREPRRITCPRCGGHMSGNICGCGTVIPDRDGTFLCRCGERLSSDEDMCRRCGRTYASTVYRVRKEFIPNGRWR